MKAPNIALLSLLLPLAASASSPWRVPVRFAVTNDAGMGYNWFVVGSHPDLGEWDVLRAVPLAWHEGGIWSANIGIQAGTELEYKFVKRPTDASEYPDANQTEWWPDDNLSLSVPAEPEAPFPAKRVVFRCPFDPPVQIVWTTLSAPSYDAVTEWHATNLVQTVPCRTDDIPGMPGTSELARRREYLPSTDTLMTTDLRGLGANYAEFLVNDVKPALDGNFRTLSAGVDPRNDPRATPVFTPDPTDHPWGTTNYTPAGDGFFFLRSRSR